MDEHVRLAARRKHAERGETCACGRVVYGNGRVSHFRVCPEHLRTYGYPLDQGMRSAIVAECGSSGRERAEREIGRRILDEGLNVRTMRWVELRDLIWACASRADSAGGCNG